MRINTHELSLAWEKTSSPPSQIEKPCSNLKKKTSALPQKKLKQEQKKDSLSQKLFSSVKKLASYKEPSVTSYDLQIPCLFSIETKENSLQNLSSEKKIDPYTKQLSFFLQKKLHLIEKEEVKIEISIKHTGELVSIVFINSGEKNRSYLKKRLPLLLFPCFNEKEKIRQYTIYLSAS